MTETKSTKQAIIPVAKPSVTPFLLFVIWSFLILVVIIPKIIPTIMPCARMRPNAARPIRVGSPPLLSGLSTGLITDSPKAWRKIPIGKLTIKGRHNMIPINAIDAIKPPNAPTVIPLLI